MTDKLLDETRLDSPVSWPGVLAGVLPFILIGPVAVLLAYPFPFPAWRTSPLAVLLIQVMYLGPAMLGTVVGCARRWPVWAYAYLGPALFVPVILLGDALSAMMGNSYGPTLWLTAPLVRLMLGLMIVAVVVASQRWGSWGALQAAVTRDWTRLSFGLFPLAAYLFASVDHDEDSVLTPYVLLPTLAIAGAAIFYLRSRSQAARVLSLLGGLCLALDIRLIGGKWYYLLYGLVMGAVIFCPVLLQWNRTHHQRSAPLNE